MTDLSNKTGGTGWNSDHFRKNLARRKRSEKRFQRIGLGAILTALTLLAILMFSIFSKGYTAFIQTSISLDVTFNEAIIDKDGTRDPEALRHANYTKLVQESLRARFPDVEGRSNLRALFGLLSNDASDTLRDMVMANPELIGQTLSVELLAGDDVDMLNKGYIDRDLAEDNRRVKDKELVWIDSLKEEGQIVTHFNSGFFTNGDSREPEKAGIAGAMVGSFYTLLITMLLSFPIGVMTAIYLEEFAPRNKFNDLIEVNINNLAAVPSIVFGLLGLAIFLNVAHLPRSAPLVGGLTLALMTLPTIIIASRAAIRAVPDSIRQAALGLGASKQQAAFHHVLPLSMPGILTGTIIGLAQALGETAPLLMIGMVAFIADIPGGINDPATVMPVQIFLWADSPERAFVEKTSGAIMVLLAFLVLMNALAVFLRKKFERRW
ncbi:MAG: phosphate ABC transporter, permease protein PstA [Sneathiella sp.]|jgi:phosphate transport system permease protein|uniref:phosphate ABC transporter permease PstA n=1 Tax=Sneathiella sp. TaxID=1964365 RepID=UPI000C4343F1|nr:phosphate ABC transporter permease PstA [Sneathiella sp.]MAL78346.1 phosphate ABC transporter, permease protein PstA [Sneathiella sp.]|tara:strand:+ start:241 stop:1548 length:1308 start_codon:yes stop_codon:yes gene_type:complete